LPAAFVAAGSSARFAYGEFLFGKIANQHTCAASRRAIDSFLAWSDELGIALSQITPKMVRGIWIICQVESPSRNNIWRRFGTSSTSFIAFLLHQVYDPLR